MSCTVSYMSHTISYMSYMSRTCHILSHMSCTISYMLHNVLCMSHTVSTTLWDDLVLFICHRLSRTNRQYKSHQILVHSSSTLLWSDWNYTTCHLRQVCLLYLLHASHRHQEEESRSMDYNTHFIFCVNCECCVCPLYRQIRMCVAFSVWTMSACVSLCIGSFPVFVFQCCIVVLNFSSY